MRVKDINALSTEDRENKLTDLRIELTRLRTMVKAGGTVDNPTKMRELRRSIAQILTIQNEKKLGIRQAAEQKPEKRKKKVAKPAKESKVKKETKETASK
jgi:large subunit ribosomal protein L29